MFNMQKRKQGRHNKALADAEMRRGLIEN